MDSPPKRRVYAAPNASDIEDKRQKKFLESKSVRATVKAAEILMTPPKFSELADEFDVFTDGKDSEMRKWWRKKLNVYYLQFHNFFFPDIPEAFPLRKKMLMAKNSTVTGNLWDILQVVLSVVACVLYVVETYVGGSPWTDQFGRGFEAKMWLNEAEVYITIFFGVDFILNWFIAASRISYLYTPMAIVDILTIVPLIITISIGDTGSAPLGIFAILRFVRILRLVRILRTFRLLGGLSGVRRQVITLCLTLLSLIFLASGIIHVMENDVTQMFLDCNQEPGLTFKTSYFDGEMPDAFMGDQEWFDSHDYIYVNTDKISRADMKHGTWETVCFDPNVDYTAIDDINKIIKNCDCAAYSCFPDFGMVDTLNRDDSKPSSVKCHILDFFDCFYFIMVTISTVGYGDVTPTHIGSKFCAVIFMVLSGVVLSIQGSRLSGLLSMGSAFRQPYIPAQEESHIVVCGFVNDRIKLERFFKEFFHPDRSIDADFKAIVLCPNEPSEDVRSLLVSPVFDSRVIFMVGSALNADDLKRARADIATAMFFLSNAEVSEEEAKYHDAATVLETLSVSNYNPDLECFVQVVKADNRDILKDSDVDLVVCLDEFKTILQGRNAICPGFTTLVELLFMSFGMVESMGEQPWFDDYLHGADMELYFVPLHTNFMEVVQYDWSLMVEAFYLQYGVMMIGVCNVKEHRVCLNPTSSEMKNFKNNRMFFRKFDVAILITGDQALASQVAVGSSEFLGIETMVDKMRSEEKDFQVRYVPKPKLKMGHLGDSKGPRGRRQSASSSLAEFAEINANSSALNAVTMDELCRGARYFYDMKVPEKQIRKTKPNQFSVIIDSDEDEDEDIVGGRVSEHVMRGRTLTDQMQDLLAVETERRMTISGVDTVSKETNSDTDSTGSDSDSVVESAKNQEAGLDAKKQNALASFQDIMKKNREIKAKNAKAVEEDRRQQQNEGQKTRGGDERIENEKTPDSFESTKPAGGGLFGAMKKATKDGDAKRNFIRAARRVSIVNSMKSVVGTGRPTLTGLRGPSISIDGDIPLEPGEVEDAENLKNHIVVSGVTNQLGHFLAELRRPLINASQTAFHPVLIVTPEMPINWHECLAAFDEIYWLKGKIVNSVDFNRINIRAAYTVVLLSMRSMLKEDDERNLDSDVLFAYLKLEKYVPAHVFLTVELSVASNMAVLNSTIMRHVRQKAQHADILNNSTHHLKRTYNGAFVTKKRIAYTETTEDMNDDLDDEMTAEERLDRMLKELGRQEAHAKLRALHEKRAAEQEDYWKFSNAEATFWDATNSHHTLPVFASGKAFVPSTFDSLLCQSFFGSLTPVVCEKIVCGQRHQTMFQVDVPQPFWGRDFLLLFRAFSARGLLVFGLYRAQCEEDGSTLPFVFLSPPPMVKIRKGDRVFVFGSPYRLQFALDTALERPFQKGYFSGSWALNDSTIPSDQ